MRKLFESGIALAVTVVSLALCIKWYWNTGEIEPMIGIIASVGALLTALIYRIYPVKKQESPVTFAMSQEISQKNVARDSTLTAEESIIVGDGNTILNQYITYAEQKIPRALTAPPFNPPVLK